MRIHLRQRLRDLGGPTMPLTIEDHVAEIQKLPTTTRDIVLDALRVRAMDFVSDRIDNDGVADQAADIYRVILGERVRVLDAESREWVDGGAFDPDQYEPILGGPLA